MAIEIQIRHMADALQLDTVSLKATETDKPMGISFKIPTWILEGYLTKPSWMMVNQNDQILGHNEVGVVVTGLEDEAEIRQALERVNKAYQGSQDDGLQRTLFAMTIQLRSMQENPNITKTLRKRLFETQIDRLSNPQRKAA